MEMNTRFDTIILTGLHEKKNQKMIRSANFLKAKMCSTTNCSSSFLTYPKREVLDSCRLDERKLTSQSPQLQQIFLFNNWTTQKIKKILIKFILVESNVID